MTPRIDRPRRLIDTHTLLLTNFNENDVIPPYAILSHRWIKGEEVVYREYAQPQPENSSKSGLGYLKIRAASDQARKDGFRYIWVDTCCIIQGDHDDIARNIKSMLSYYQHAEVCYAYLADVDANVKHSSQLFQWILTCYQCAEVCYAYLSHANGVNHFNWQLWWMLSGSEWFERGWTLQELLAPGRVVFFDKAWTRIGTKHELCREISYVTMIPDYVLSGQRSFRDIHAIDRISWAIGRQTTKVQDQAYCMQGLLEVSLDPDYDEGLENSFWRLGKVFVASHLNPQCCGPVEMSYYRLFEKRNVVVGTLIALRIWRKFLTVTKIFNFLYLPLFLSLPFSYFLFPFLFRSSLSYLFYSFIFFTSSFFSPSSCTSVSSFPFLTLTSLLSLTLSLGLLFIPIF